MSEPYASEEVDDLYLQMSPWGDFFVWTSRHVQWLRRQHRIFGRLLSQKGILSSSSVTPAKTTLAAIPSVRLPLCLSLEETSLLLYQRIAKGLDIVTPLTDLQPPLVSDLFLYDEALATHFEEVAEVYQAQKRQKMLSYYGEMLAGKRKRRTRHAGRNLSKTEAVDKEEEKEGDIQVDEFGKFQLLSV
uniref:TSEN34 N-terminal domain-containing protein n=1 Tax=Schistocephalus solidus TaxID=70667 RepID=A0A0X3P3U3_SCHSO